MDDVPNLTKEDLICLVSSREAALCEAIDKVRPNLKQTLSDKELSMLRKSMVNLRSSYKTHFASVHMTMSRLKEKHSGWLQTSVRVPTCLLRDGSQPDTELGKCANCQIRLKDDSKENPVPGRSSEKTLHAFQVVFEGLLNLGDVKLPNNLPELCSNCESLLLSLHTLYAEFMSLTQTQSPVHTMLHRWKNGSKPDPVVNSRHSVQPRNRRKSLKAIEANEAKIQKRSQHQPEPECILEEESSNELTHEDSNFVELEDDYQEPEEPKAEVPLPVIVTQSLSRPAAAYIKQTLYFECLRCSTAFVGQTGFLKHRRSNHTIFPEPNYRIVPIHNTQTHMADPTVAESEIDESSVLLEPNQLSTVSNGESTEHSQETMDVEEVMKGTPDNSKIRKRKATKEMTNMERKCTKEPKKLCSSNRAESGRPKPNVAVVHGQKARQSKEIIKSQRKSCPYCDEVVLGMTALSTHITSHLPHLNTQQNNHEPTSVSVPPVPAHHMPTSVEDSSRSKCPECGMTFKKKRSYRHHLQWHKMQFGPDFPCPHCGDLLKGTKLLLHHIRLFHKVSGGGSSKDRPFVCPYKPCLTAYRGTTKANLRDHISTYHADQLDKSRPFQCDTCPSAYQEQGALDRHKAIRHSRHPCHLCAKSFSLKTKLTSHLRRIHVPLDESQLIQCEICGLKRRNKNSLKIHLLKHQPDRRPAHLCDLCGKRYFTPAKLRVHVSVVHEGIRNHICPHCGIAFGKPEILKNHVLAKHSPSTGPGFPCTICGKVFKLKTYLYQHSISKVHGGPGLSRSKRREKAKREEQEQVVFQEDRELDSETIQSSRLGQNV